MKITKAKGRKENEDYKRDKEQSERRNSRNS